MTDTQAYRGHLIGIIGAGPAGLYAAKELAEAGVHVVLFNRDIKPGGLAEYGIFPTKHKMKEGLRKPFHRILAYPQVDYYGNCSVGEKGELTLSDLQTLGFDALICAAGAQGTKSLGLPGEDAIGVMHAKDLVLEEAERQIAVQVQSEEYKFDSNEAMLEAINCQKARMA